MDDDFRADLHSHSNYSDGSDTPQQLLLLAQKMGLRGLSITDHDTIEAYKESSLLATQNPLLLPGVEFSAECRGESVHILGYAFLLESDTISSLCRRHKERREERVLKMIERLRGLGIRLEIEEIQAATQGTWGRPHIAAALMRKGIVRSLQEAFDTYLGEGKPAYVLGETITVEETLEVIRQGKGKAVLAHPHLIKRSTTIRTLLKMPFDGLECYYSRLSPGAEKKWIDLARQRNWIITGGSDYHGLAKPHNALGTSWVGQQTFELLYNHYLKVNGK
jgi:predicted metal-dependent phosphoesterase TrpH